MGSASSYQFVHQLPRGDASLHSKPDTGPTSKESEAEGHNADLATFDLNMHELY